MANIYKNAKVDLTTTNITTLYTAPTATTAIFRSLLISNDSGSNYDRVSECYTQMDHGTRYSTVNSEAFVSVTSTSTFRCRIETESSGNFTVRSSNGQSMLDFIRLGDAT